MCNVVADQLEIRLVEQMLNVELLAGEEVIDADDVVALGYETVTQVRAEKSGAAGDEDAFNR